MFALGCSSGGGGPALAPVDGEVIYQGKPIAGANVLFVPEKGPVALGITDTDGKFRLSTGGSRGAVVGNCKATVSVAAPEDEVTLAPPKTQAEAEAYMKKANEMQEARIAAQAAPQKAASLIPAKYAKAETSGLSYTVKPGNNNHFKIELQ